MDSNKIYRNLVRKNCGFNSHSHNESEPLEHNKMPETCKRFPASLLP